MICISLLVVVLLPVLGLFAFGLFELLSGLTSGLQSMKGLD